MGREDFYAKSGADYQALLALGVITVTVNLNLNYRRECRQGDKLIVHCRPSRLGRTSFVVRQEIWKGEEALVADAEVTIVTIDALTRQSHPVPEVLSRLFKSSG